MICVVDVFSKKKRSQIMTKIKAKNTKIEILFMKALRKKRIHYTGYPGKVPGHPDLVLKDKKIAVFVDGCFWHKCPKCYTEPQSNLEYWRKKIEYNVRKDRKVNKELRSSGWTVFRVWEHDINQNIDTCINKLKKKIS